MEKNLKNKLLPFVLTFVVIILDQITKSLIVAKIPPYTIGPCFLGDFLRIIHVRNTGVAFSMGSGWNNTIRAIMFLAVPIIVIGCVISVYFRNNEFSSLQRWCITGIIGGGIGNLVDRFFRPDGVVDFIDFKFYGLFGLDRWPTFNIADTAVVICGFLLLISFLISVIRESKGKTENSKETE